MKKKSISNEYLLNVIEKYNKSKIKQEMKIQTRNENPILNV